MTRIFRAMSLICAPYCLVISFVMPCAARDDEAVTSYAMAFSAAMEAQSNCPGTRPSESALYALNARTGLDGSAEDDAFLVAQFADWKRTYHQGIVEKGAIEWCRGVLQLFGPKSAVPVIEVIESR